MPGGERARRRKSQGANRQRGEKAIILISVSCTEKYSKKIFMFIFYTIDTKICTVLNDKSARVSLQLIGFVSNRKNCSI